jgi:hypothetical protein
MLIMIINKSKAFLCLTVNAMKTYGEVDVYIRHQLEASGQVNDPATLGLLKDSQIHIT